MPLKHRSQLGHHLLPRDTPPSSESSDFLGYPRPGSVNPQWRSLNGDGTLPSTWTQSGTARPRSSGDRKIAVPFAPGTQRSGIGDTSFYKAVGLVRASASKRSAPNRESGCSCTSARWITPRRSGSNGSLAVARGRLHAVLPSTSPMLLRRRRTQSVVVRADDDPHDLAKPRGKQDWQLEPHSIWYPRTTGIWQTRVAGARAARRCIGMLRWTPNLERWEIGFEARVAATRARMACASRAAARRRAACWPTTSTA